MRFVTTTLIRRLAERVFAFLTTPANWPLWHPSSVKVTGAVDHPLQPGEQVTEEFVVAGQSGKAVWTVRECRAPITGFSTAWRRTATGPPELSLEGENPKSEIPTGPTFGICDFGFGASEEALETFRQQVDAESTEALRRLKTLLETMNDER